MDHWNFIGTSFCPHHLGVNFDRSLHDSKTHGNSKKHLSFSTNEIYPQLFESCSEFAHYILFIVPFHTIDGDHGTQFSGWAQLPADHLCERTGKRGSLRCPHQ